MTELLPLPKGFLRWLDRHAADAEDAADARVFIEHYARANLAPLQAENERLRAEVAEWKRVAAAQAELHGDSEARAERLAEALRVIETKLVHSMDHAKSSLERKRAMSECADAARAALAQEDRND